INAARWLQGKPLLVPPETTAIGGLLRYLVEAPPENFQPMNVNFGLFPPLAGRVPRLRRRLALSQRALEDLETWRKTWSPIHRLIE
ncbi:MAG: methylenetetrahydrofolate--tRNA-(uracil(54)-C(5))-methyltransferase (FADH(2)-oxidizing) TrmFO, partial [Chloroflexota bacterium]